jgi:hypothetical protein
MGAGSILGETIGKILAAIFAPFFNTLIISPTNYSIMPTNYQ